ncbi:MAG: SAM-dependent methyltransferase [Lentisphaeria bacterium]|jgi:SAM-dependent methyltransferase
MSSTVLCTELAHSYDLVCSEINYQDQSKSACRIHHLFGNGGLACLDLGCGTGPHIDHFVQKGYRVTGLDLNQAILDQAALRCPQGEFSLQDMSKFRLDSHFDLITCFLYSLHYCYPYEKFENGLSHTFAALNPGGFFVLTASTINAVRPTVHSTMAHCLIFNLAGCMPVRG